MIRSPLSLLALLAAGTFLSGCATRPVNPPITSTDPQGGYRFAARQA